MYGSLRDGGLAGPYVNIEAFLNVCSKQLGEPLNSVF